MELKGQPEQRPGLSKTPLAPLELYIENAPLLAQKVLACWNDISKSGLSEPTVLEFSGLVERARRYEAARKLLENRGKSAMSSEQDNYEVEQMRLEFAQEYKRLDDMTGSADELLKSKLEPTIEDPAR